MSEILVPRIKKIRKTIMNPGLAEVQDARERLAELKSL